ncbi:HPr family phosphocarrier protein [Bacillus sp. FJAT-45350]|uniref:HPr family phosphocarrier protein n=1 Tax=Bacillus sp. FJAT-45350 TaxID=2011014 RepID=UPI00211B78DD|nr:HPr family phosphocarrier protein [Bacillus sp. FJAT-45350]
MTTSQKEITVNISEEQTIVELSKKIQSYKSEIFLSKVLRGTPMEVNLKSFLGLITLHLENHDKILVRAVGEDSTEALEEVVSYLT